MVDRSRSDIGAGFIQCDATDEQQVADCFVTRQKINHGKIDILVVNAGVADDEGSIEEFATDSYEASCRRQSRWRILSALKYGPRHMNDGGSIITTGSVAGAGTTNAGAGVYAASKAGVAYLTRTCAIEVARAWDPRQYDLPGVDCRYGNGDR